jgi:hypothetical protein
MNASADFLDDVHALDRHADLSRVEKRAEHGGAGGAVEVGVGAHDERILAAELERARDEPPAARPRRSCGRCDAAGERDLVDACVDERGAGLAVADDDLENAGRQSPLRRTARRRAVPTRASPPRA